MPVFGTYQGVSSIMHKAFHWNRSRISMLEVEAGFQGCIPHVQIGLSIVVYVTSGFRHDFPLHLPFCCVFPTTPACRRPSDTATVSCLQSRVSSADWSFTSYSAPTSSLQGWPPADPGLLCKCSCVIRIYEQPEAHTIHHHPPAICNTSQLRGNWEILAVKVKSSLKHCIMKTSSFS
jgi:hypothetical protein